MNVAQEAIPQLSDFFQSELLDTRTVGNKTPHACFVKTWALSNEEALQIRVCFEKSLPASWANEEGAKKLNALQERKRCAKNFESGVVEVSTEVEAE